MWFPDTSALVTLAVHTPLGDDVRSALGQHRIVLLEDVVEELEDLAGSHDPAKVWADKALGELEWLGTPVALGSSWERAVEFQELIRGTRPLRHPKEHWGESAILALATQARTTAPIMLSDDYKARVAADNEGVKAVSVHKLMHLLIRRGRMSPAVAESHAAALCAAGRSKDYTAEDLTVGRLMQVGMP